VAGGDGESTVLPCPPQGSMCGASVHSFSAPFCVVVMQRCCAGRAPATNTPRRMDVRPVEGPTVCRPLPLRPSAFGVAYDTWPCVSVRLCASAEVASGPPVCYRRVPRWLGFMHTHTTSSYFGLTLGLDTIVDCIGRDKAGTAGHGDRSFIHWPRAGSTPHAREGGSCQQ
jgi:hypothetical protein